MYGFRGLGGGLAGLAFTTSRGSGLTQDLHPGDTWTISITGAAPNAAVTVSGTTPGGSFSGSQMGMTDGNGNWSKSGTTSAGEVGTWVEHWMVNGQDAGTIVQHISVAGDPPPPPPPADPHHTRTRRTWDPPAAPTMPATVAAPTIQYFLSAPSQAPAAVQDSGSSFSIGEVPWWGWAAAAGVAVFALGGRRGR